MDQNEVLFDRAQKSIPGGVNSRFVPSVLSAALPAL